MVALVGVLCSHRQSPRGPELTSSLSVAGAVLGQLPQAFSSEGRAHVSLDLAASKGSWEQHTNSHTHTSTLTCVIQTGTHAHVFTQAHLRALTSPLSNTFMHAHPHASRHTHNHTRLLSILSLTHSFTSANTHLYIHHPHTLTNALSHNPCTYINPYHTLTCTHPHTYVIHAHSHTCTHTQVFTLPHAFTSHFLRRS